MTTALRIPSVTPTGPYGMLLKQVSRRMFGSVPESLGVLWHNRKVLNLNLTLGRKAQQWGQCDESLKTFAHMAVACLVGCDFCLDAGYFQAHHAGLDVNKAREVPRWRESGTFTPLERDAMEYAEAMSHTPPTVTEEMSQHLLETLGPAAMVELTSYIALANLMTRTNTAFGIGSEGLAASCGLAPLAVASTA